MTRPYSIAFKQKMVDRLTAKNAVSAVQLAGESSVRQQNLSRWAAGGSRDRGWTVEQKARVVAEASKLTGDQLAAHLEREGVKLADFERWRIALENDGSGSTAAARRIRQLERELARKEKALKKRMASLLKDEDDDTDGRSEI